MNLQILVGGRGTEALARVDSAVRLALRAHHAGESPDPLFLVPPGTDAQAANADALRLGVPADAGVLMRTSGSTTGTGKIVALSWDALIASANATHDAFGGPGRWVAELPLHHIAGFQTVARTALHALRSGNEALTAAHLDLSDADAVVAALSGCEGADSTGGGPASSDFPADRVYFSLVPTQLLRILDNPPLLDALRHAVFLVGGAGVRTETLNRARAEGIDIHTSYGMTETCGGCVYDGQPIGDTEVSFDETGRISLRGRAVALGYLGTDEDFTTELTGIRSHHTKDAGRLTDGRLEVLGRIDDAITTGGLTVMPSLIEASLAKTGWDAVVVGVPHLEWGEAVVAVIDDRDHHAQSCNVTIMRSFVKLELGEGWAPTFVVGLSDLGGELPHTDSGKLNRRELSDMVADHLGL